jgi:heterodisulfide reductase subunit A
MSQREEVRIGVFVCHCGSNIGGWLDVPAVAEYAGSLPNVAHAEHNLYTCAEDGLAAIRRAIKEHHLNRVIVASCTPRTHEPLFQGACEDAGLNRYLFEFVNIRDQCSWIHMQDREKATEKAMDLVRMGVAKATRLQPLERSTAEVEPSALVLGGGITGMTAARTIARSGFQVHLVERASVLGGLLNRLHRIWPTEEDPKGFLDGLREDLESEDLVHIMTGTEMKGLKGFVGNFDVTLGPVSGEGEETDIRVGTIIVATGADEMKPTGLYGYGEVEGVITELELEAMLRDERLPDIGNAVFIQCAGSRGQRVTYCSRVCCMTGIKNAMELRERNPDANVTVLYRDVMAYGISYEELYQRARVKGVRFVRHPKEEVPAVEQGEDGKVRVTYRDIILGREVSLEADLLVLSTPLVQHEDAKDLAQMLRVPLGQDRFFFEAHVKLRPIDFASDGIFLAGTAHGPKDIEESTVQALGVAGRSLTFLKAGQVLSEPIVTVVDEETCIGCGNCVEVCPYGAIELKEGGKRGQVAEVNPGLCKGCGTCPGACPSGSIQQLGFTDGQILAMIRALANGGD